MQILQAYPLTFSRSLFNCLDRDFVLATAHCELMIARSANNLLCESLQLSTWVRSGRDNKHNRLFAVGLIFEQIF